MNQMHRWALRHAYLLYRHLEEQKDMLASHDRTLSLLQARHQEELARFSRAGELTQISLIIQQAEEKQILINSFTKMQSVMQDRQDKEEQAVLYPIEQEKVRQN